MAASNTNYQKYYRGFCERLKSDPTLKFSAYCDEVGVSWRRLYDWMTRRHISLKRLYAGYDQPIPEVEKKVVGGMSDASAFTPLKIDSSAPKASGARCRNLHIKLPHGVCLEIGECDVEFLINILGGPLGKCHV